MIFRITAFIIVFLLIIYGYWWLTWLLAIIFLFYFPSYYEIILWGIIYDSIYSLEIPMFYDFKYIFTVFSIVTFLLSHYVQKRLSIYD